MAQDPKPRAAASAKTASKKKAAKKKAVRKTSPSKPAGPVDIRMVREVLELMENHQVTEFEVEQEGVRLKLRKGSAEAVNYSYAPAPAMPPPPRPDAPPEPAAKMPENANAVKSPMVGTFYRSPSPDSDVFVKVGDVVDEETVVCIIEAMKVMNEIKAEASGEIVQALVENGETVEYGQPLFLLKPA